MTLMNGLESLDTTSPVTYKRGRLTDFQLLGEVLMYGAAMFCGSPLKKIKV